MTVKWQDLRTGLTAAASHGHVQGVSEDVRDTLGQLGWIGGSEGDDSGVYPTVAGWRWIKRFAAADRVIRGVSHR